MIMEEVSESVRLEKRNALLSERINELYQIINFVKGTVYWKDLDGIYLGCNHAYLEQLVQNSLLASSEENIVGKTDFDIFPNVVAHEYRCNDKKVIAEKRELRFTEIDHFDDKVNRLLLSIKRPLCSSNGEVLGVIGNTIDFSSIAVGGKEVVLSRRELQCYAALFFGMSAKETGRHFDLSSKTVESYLANLKNKMGVSSRSILIKVALMNDLDMPFKEIIGLK